MILLIQKYVKSSDLRNIRSVALIVVLMDQKHKETL